MRGRFMRKTQTMAVMVTPGWSADCACVLSDKHSDYARAAVIAYWRMMDTASRHRLLRQALLLDPDVTEAKLDREPIRTVLFGHTSFRHPPVRFLGVQDLVLKFDTAKVDTKGRPLGWALALVEMLVDPMLASWVPSWVREQYEQWIPYFRSCLRSLLREHTKKSKAALRLTDVVAEDLRDGNELAAAAQEQESVLVRAPAHGFPV